MRKWKLCLVGFFFGFGGFFFSPLGFKFFFFIVPTIILSHVLSKDEDLFNINIFVLLLLGFMLIPTNLFTFDASKPMDVEVMFSGVFAMLSVICVVIFFGMPIYLAVGVIYSFLIGQVSQSSKQLMRLIFILAFLMVILAILRMVGANIPYLDGVTDFYVTLINLCFQFPYIIYNIFDSGIKLINSMSYWLEEIINEGDILDLDEDADFPKIPRLPPLPTYRMPKMNLTFDATQSHFNSMSYTDTVYAIHDSLPISISIICLITALFMIKKDWEKQIISYINQFTLDTRKPSKERIYFPYVNFKLLLYMFFLIFFAFLIFLSYSRTYGKDPREDWRYIGFFGIYMTMAVTSILVLNLQGYTYYKDSNLVNTIKGTLVGLAVLYLMTRLFTTQQVVNAYSTMDISKDMMYVVNTFVFIAPAESLFFHIFYPSIIAGKLKSYSEKKRGETIDISRRDVLIDLELEKKHTERRLEKERVTGNKRNVEVTIAILNDIEQDLGKFENLEIQADLDEKSIFGRKNTSVLFIIFGVIAGNFMFAFSHWIIPWIMSDYTFDFFTFVSCGLFALYFAGGCWMTYVGIKWGWASAILVHAIFNVLTIMLVIATMGAG